MCETREIQNRILRITFKRWREWVIFQFFPALPIEIDHREENPQKGFGVHYENSCCMGNIGIWGNAHWIV